jgi:hypothetical protein
MKPHESNQLTDTRQQAETVLVALLRKKAPWEKLQMVSQLNATMRTLMMTGIAHRNPELNEQQRRRKLFEQILGTETAEKVCVLANRRSSDDE